MKDEKEELLNKIVRLNEMKKSLQQNIENLIITEKQTIVK